MAVNGRSQCDCRGLPSTPPSPHDEPPSLSSLTLQLKPNFVSAPRRAVLLLDTMSACVLSPLPSAPLFPPAPCRDNAGDSPSGNAPWCLFLTPTTHYSRDWDTEILNAVTRMSHATAFTPRPPSDFLNAISLRSASRPFASRSLKLPSLVLRLKQLWDHKEKSHVSLPRSIR